VLAPEALSSLHRFADDVDAAAPATLSGLYAVGSLALGDWRAQASNLDLLAVADTTWAPEVVRRLEAVVGAIGPHARAARVGFVTWADLAGDPKEVDAAVLVGKHQVASEELVNAMTWEILRLSAICIRGPEYPDVRSVDVRAWSDERILTVWPAALDRWRHRPSSLWFRRQTAPAVLETARLSVMATSGRVVSKLAAGEGLIDGARSNPQKLLKDSVGYRQGSRTSMYWGPFERKQDTMDWVRSIIDRARLAKSGER
jgi:hypothetical protein